MARCVLAGVRLAAARYYRPHAIVLSRVSRSRLGARSDTRRGGMQRCSRGGRAGKPRGGPGPLKVAAWTPQEVTAIDPSVVLRMATSLPWRVHSHWQDGMLMIAKIMPPRHHIDVGGKWRKRSDQGEPGCSIIHWFNESPSPIAPGRHIRLPKAAAHVAPARQSRQPAGPVRPLAPETGKKRSVLQPRSSKRRELAA
jgi:hypothetical protein